MSDEQVVLMAGSQAGRHDSPAAQAEMMRRLIVAMNELKAATDARGRTLNGYTILLFIVTVVILVHDLMH